MLLHPAVRVNPLFLARHRAGDRRRVRDLLESNRFPSESQPLFLKVRRAGISPPGSLLPGPRDLNHLTPILVNPLFLGGVQPYREGSRLPAGTSLPAFGAITRLPGRQASGALPVGRSALGGLPSSYALPTLWTLPSGADPCQPLFSGWFRGLPTRTVYKRPGPRIAAPGRTTAVVST